MKKIYLIIVGILMAITVLAQENYILTGVVKNEKGAQIDNGFVIKKDTNIGDRINEVGRFSISLSEGEHTLMISSLGYKTQLITVNVPYNGTLEINMEPLSNELSEVEILSTGYQEIPKERSTGSFAYLDEELINRRFSTNLTERLEDVTSGLILNRTGSADDPISIRGRSTLLGNASPLIIIDGFPYDGSIDNINPNDVENITVLKDAAAASIWGTQAANGVIVITTKQGDFEKPLQVSATANVNIRQAPSLFDVPIMTSADYVDLEARLFEEGAFIGEVNAFDNRALSPVAELIRARDAGNIIQAEYDNALANLRTQDYRNDLERYAYQEQVEQQYNVALRGGSARQSYQVSLGVDRVQENLVRNNSHRITINAGQQIKLYKDILQLNTGLYYVENSSSRPNQLNRSLNLSSSRTLPTYVSLVDATGQPRVIPQDYRLSLLEQAQADGLLDWGYNPLDDINHISNTSRVRDMRFNANLIAQISKSFSIDTRYQYWSANQENRLLNGAASYFARDQVNRYTEVNSNGTLTRHIPEGGILNIGNANRYSHNARSQVNYTGRFGNHQINGIAGFEYKILNGRTNNARYYGYNDEIAAVQPVNYTTQFSLYPTFGVATIPRNESIGESTDRFISYYANVGYTFKTLYDVTLSARKDQSNLFGVNSNQRGVPLWSVGAGYTISEADWYDSGLLPYLKLRATYGYNGNIDKSISAFTTATRRGVSSINNRPFAEILNPPNPDLVWERVRMINVGVDFECRNGILGGSIEYFNKRSLDLLGFIVPAPSTGITLFRGNTSDMTANGVDIQLYSNNLQGEISWRTDYLYSMVKEEVGLYESSETSNFLLQQSSSGIFPITGYPLFTVFSIPWAGLNPQTGDPRFIYEGEVSEDYVAINSDTELDKLKFHGSARPRAFGAFRNTFSYKGFTLSANISFRLNYYFRAPSITYGSLEGLGGHADYYDRWQQPGDEDNTYVPSIPSANNPSRDFLYSYSSVLVNRGDHIRLQDIRLSYDLDPTRLKAFPFAYAQVYAYVNNVGILWKKTDLDVDPDFLTQRPPRSIAFGLNINF